MSPPMLHAPELLLIDFDGVLADLDERLRLQVLSTLTGHPADAVARALLQRPAQAGEHHTDADAPRCAALGQALGCELPLAQWHGARMQATRLRGDSVALLRLASARTPVAVLSNNPAALAEPIARMLGLPGLPASRVLTSGALGLRKPDPACFLAAVDTLQARPERTLFIDNLFVNVRGARAAGLQADTAHHTQSLRRVLKRFHLLR